MSFQLIKVASVYVISVISSSLIALSPPQVASEGLPPPTTPSISLEIAFIEAETPKTILGTPWLDKLLKTPYMRLIASCESGLKQFNEDGSVLRGRVNPKDIGIFQINEDYHLAKSKELGMDIYTEEGNIEYAFHLFSTEGAKPWIWSFPCHGIM